MTGNAHTIALMVRSFQRELDALLAKSRDPMTGTIAVSAAESGYRIDLTINLSHDAAADLLSAETPDPT